MQATSDAVYKQINNALYNEQGDTWWDENHCLHLLKSSVNPARVGYFRRLLRHVLRFDCSNAAALDVGCGGGILAEEFTRMAVDTHGQTTCAIHGVVDSVPGGNRGIDSICP